MKNIILSIIASFLFSILSFANDNQVVQIKVKNASVYGQNVEGNYEGNLIDFAQSEFFNFEYAKGELELLLLEDGSYYKNAKIIARYFWKHLSKNTSVTPPYPCGQYFQGVINEDFTQDENGTINYFQITGKGDGVFDSCIGNGGPGMWSYRVTVHFNPKMLTGFVNYSFVQE
jgi:hypothetical protein